MDTKLEKNVLGYENHIANNMISHMEFSLGSWKETKEPRVTPKKHEQNMRNTTKTPTSAQNRTQNTRAERLRMFSVL